MGTLGKLPGMSDHARVWAAHALLADMTLLVPPWGKGLAAEPVPDWTAGKTTELKGLTVSLSAPVQVARSKRYLWFPTLVRLDNGDHRGEGVELSRVAATSRRACPGGVNPPARQCSEKPGRRPRLPGSIKVEPGFGMAVSGTMPTDVQAEPEQARC
jgi:hypothetical protein